MVAVTAVLEVAGIRPITEAALAILFAVAAGIGVDVAVPDLPGNLVEQFVHILAQFAQLCRSHKRSLLVVLQNILSNALLPL